MRKKYKVILCIIIMLIPFTFARVKYTEEYFSQGSNFHGEMIECALDLLREINPTIGRSFSDIADYIENTQFMYNNQMTSVEDILIDAQRLADDPNDDGVVNWWETKEHFWDPAWHEGMTCSTSAPEFTRRRFCDALNYYDDGEMANAFLYFGWALHLVQDVTVPYHCAKTVEDAGCTPIEGPHMHTAYEALVDSTWGNYDPNNAQWSSIVTNQVVNYTAKKDFLGLVPGFSSYQEYGVEGWVHNAAIMAYRHRDNITNNLPTINSKSRIVGTEPDEWKIAVRDLVPYCVSITAGFLVYIWQYIDTATNDLLGDNIVYDDLDNDGLTIYDEDDLRWSNYQTSNYTNPDTDYDGMDDYYEFIYDLDRCEDDSSDDPDDDDLVNIDEYKWESNPRCDDTDDDSLEDGWESDYWINHGFPMGSDIDSDGLTNLNDQDSDGDSLSDYNEIYPYSLCPYDTDTDNDNFNDGNEFNYWRNRGFSNIEAAQRCNLWDVDFDLLKDGDEVNIYNTDPLKRDTDSDGLDDYLEIHVFVSNPTLWDTDGDLLNDYWEVFHGYNPNLQDTDNDSINDSDEDYDEDELSNEIEFYYSETDPAEWDTDSDTLPDGWEYYQETDPLVYSKNDDPDYDGLANYIEYNEGTDPRVVDTDGDGWGDGSEVITYGTDPTDPNDYPVIPLAVNGFIGISNGINKIIFTWNQPSNWQPDWYYKVCIKIDGEYQEIYNASNTFFQYYPPNKFTNYEYRITCCITDELFGPYSYWTGKVGGLF